MIYLQEHSGTTVALTLKEKQTLTNPEFYIEFINTQTLNGYVLKITDISIRPDRYNLFQIDLPSTLEYGYYDYICYESASGFSRTLILETGKMLYQKDTIQEIVYQNNDYTTTNVNF